MSLADADVICFDADNTLIQYTNENFVRLQYTSMAKCLVKQGAPELLLSMISPGTYTSLACTCLVADFRTGCLLKLSENHTILKAFHGLKPCENVEELYGSPPVYHLTNEFQYYIKGERLIYLTHFAIGGAILWLACVELMNQKVYNLESYVELSELIRNAIHMNYLNVDRSQSEYYSEFYANPQLYISKVSENFKENLVKLRKAGKKLVVVTNSYHEYTNFIFEYAYGPNWHSYFDAYVFAAGKPEFFFKDDEMEEITHLQFDGDSYQGGSSGHLQSKMGGHKYVFVGDHYLGDIHGPKQNNWKTVALIEEIYYEKSIAHLASPSEIENAEFSSPCMDSRNYFSNWGSHFADDSQRTYWWSFILQHADVVIPNIESIYECFNLDLT